MKSINQVPECRRSPAILCGQQDEAAAIVDDDDSHDTTIPPQFIRINIFKSRDSFAEEDFAVGDDYDSGWNYLIQMEEDDWILADSIINLSFVFPEEEVRAHQHDDCRGMFNFFVLKHRRSQSGFVSLIPRLACPPFGVQLDGFDKFWSVDNCHMIFNSIRQIARGLQRLLWRSRKVTFQVTTSKYMCLPAVGSISSINLWLRVLLALAVLLSANQNQYLAGDWPTTVFEQMATWRH